jgi:hypothetical protein
MAISVDTIYQRVLVLANKEQRGYITPQEFNLLANQAQMSIFESYFYVKNQRDRAEPARTNQVDETDISELLDRKLSPFQSFERITSGHTFPSAITLANPVATLDVFQTGLVFLNNEPCQKVSIYDAQRLKKSQRHMATTSNQAPIYSNNKINGRDVLVYAGSTTEEADFTLDCGTTNSSPTVTHTASALVEVGLGVSGDNIPAGATVLSVDSTTQFTLSTNATGSSSSGFEPTLTFSPNITVECFRVPRTVEWTYVVVNNKALHNATVVKNFELHKSEEDTLVYRILELSGIVMNKVGLAQTAAQMSGSESQVQNT